MAIPGNLPAIKIAIQRMACTGCGAEANASCNCGKPYVPKAVRAAEAIAANPEKSDRAIAANIGVDHKTVSTARKATGESSPVERTGLDGKTRKLPRPSMTVTVGGNSRSAAKAAVEQGHSACDHLIKLMQGMTPEARADFRLVIIPKIAGDDDDEIVEAILALLQRLQWAGRAKAAVRIRKFLSRIVG
jgi:hypothetical protein